jgi:SulP family sulfate permease
LIAVVEAYRAGLFARIHWLPNLIAGLVVGIVALPLAMAFAIASGARPEQGIYTAIIGGGLISIFGGSRLQIQRVLLSPYWRGLRRSTVSAVCK